MHRRLVLVVSLVILTLLVAACSPQTPPAAQPAAPSSPAAPPAPAPAPAPAAPVPRPAARNVLNVALFGEPDFIDPHVSTSIGFVPLDNAYESLVYMDKASTTLVGQLAESWTASPDGTLFTFKLRQGVKFHDGAVMDAEAVKASFERIKKLNKGPVWTLSHLESITVKDPLTVEMKVKPGGPPFLEGLWQIRIVSPKAVQEQAKGDDLAQDYLNRVSAGTGPYKIVSWERNQKVTLEKFDDYWGGWNKPGHFTHVNMIQAPEASTQQLMLEKGEIDMAFKFPAEALPALEKNPNLAVIRDTGLRVLYLKLNYRAEPTSNVKVRQAINYAFDFPSFNKSMEGTYDAPTGPVPPAFLGNWSPKYPYKFDAAKAKALLNEAGYSENNKARLLAGITNNPDQRKAAQITQANLKATGAADMEIREMDFQVMLRNSGEWLKSKDPALLQHMFGLFTPPRSPDPHAYVYYIYHSKSSGAFARNTMHYANPAVDALLDKALSTLDRQARLDIYRNVTQMLVDDAADLFIGVQSKVYPISKKLQGFYAHPIWYPHVRVYDISRG